ncbi:neuronal acetylcholine receptor subunit alpha-6 [Drosophila ficusphila]|uniref:neuronal acetylcholine receptor subunit alpha-6 n=1 Tax=Drosophila ficusphila TaxID=30025 RepID=UPI0007E7B034|nr:neuronal acetylcholine receptor subunit alpha-6 [Drosophila ficusphila]
MDNLIKCLVAMCCCLFLVPLIDQAESAQSQSRFNVSFSQLDSCESISIPNTGYGYRTFFMVHELDNNNRKAGEWLHLKFYVMTSMDAHILLSVTNHLRGNDRVYEIVIGAGGNTFSAIRTAMGFRRVATNHDHNLVSLHEPTPIEIVQTQNGELFVYIPGFKKEPLLQFIDESPLSIKYISFSSFGSNTARWFYDCGFDGYEKEISSVVTELKPAQKLLNLLNFQAENASLPANLSSILFHFQTRSLAYEQTNSLFRTGMHLLMHWEDKRLGWKPAEFDGLESFEHPELQVWTPRMNVLNGALESMGEVLVSHELRVYANGNITLYAHNLQLTSWCVDSARNWPNERVTCDVELGLIGQEGLSIALVYDNERNPIAPNEHVNLPSGWSFSEMSVVQVGNDSVRRYTPKQMLQTVAGDVAIEFTVQRNRSFYRAIFFLPIFACQLFLMMSFVLGSNYRSSLIFIAILITAWGLMYMTRLASPHYVPPIMTAYKLVMMVATYCYLLHICIIWLEFYPPRAKAPGCLVALINSKALRCLLGLRLTDSSDFCEVQEKPWHHFAKILNNFSFNLVFVVFAIIDITCGI